MKPTHTLVTALGLAFALMSSQASAQDAGKGGRGRIPFSAYDADGDGSITTQEFQDAKVQRGGGRGGSGKSMQGAGRAASFEELDTDGDGKLTPDELDAGRGKGSGRAHRRPRHSFEDVDTDGDGAISESEFHEAHAARIRESAEQGRPMKHARTPTTFADIDSDGDGSISREEFSAHQAKRHGSMPRH